MASSKHSDTHFQSSLLVFLFLVGMLLLMILKTEYNTPPAQVPANSRLHQLLYTENPLSNTESFPALVRQKDGFDACSSGSNRNDIIPEGEGAKVEMIKLSGYWKEVRASFGLVPLPDIIRVPVECSTGGHQTQSDALPQLSPSGMEATWTKNYLGSSRSKKTHLWWLGRLNPGLRRGLQEMGSDIAKAGSDFFEEYNLSKRHGDPISKLSSRWNMQNIKASKEKEHIVTSLNPQPKSKADGTLLSALEIIANITFGSHSAQIPKEDSRDLLESELPTTPDSESPVDEKISESPGLFLSEDSKPGKDKSKNNHATLGSIAAAFRAIAAHELNSKSHNHRRYSDSGSRPRQGPDQRQPQQYIRGRPYSRSLFAKRGLDHE